MDEAHKKTILVDMDGVIADQHGWILLLLKNNHPEIYATYKGEDTEFDFEQNFPEAHHAFVRALREQEGFFHDLPRISGAKEALEDMKAQGHNVYICTAPIWNYHYCVPEKFEWVEHNLGREWVMRILTARDKTVVNGHFLIDDKPEVMGVHTPSWKHIIFDQPYNRHVTNKPRLDWTNYKDILGI